MRILIELDDFTADINLTRLAPGTRFADLISAAGGPNLVTGETPLYLEGVRISPDTLVEKHTLLEGSVLSSRAAVPLPSLSHWTLTLAGGADSGTIVPVPTQRAMVIGRSPYADLTLPTESASWEHLRIEAVKPNEAEKPGNAVELHITDSKSTNGTIVNGEKVGEEGVRVTDSATLTVGGTTLLLRKNVEEPRAPKPGALKNLTPAGTAPFNRPPRLGDPAPLSPLVPPVRKDIPPANKFSYITALAPLVMAVVMVMMMGDMRYALFALLSPITAVGMWFEQRRKHKKNTQEEQERFTAALLEFQDQIKAQATQETARRHAMAPDPATVVRRAALPTTSMWQRRRGAPDFLALHAGTGHVPWQPRLGEHTSSTKDDAVQTILDHSALASAPVLVNLTEAGVVGIVGERAGALALARSLLVQAAVHVGPADLTIGVFCDPGEVDEWDWAAWLPHTHQAGGSAHQRWMAANKQQSNTLLRTLLDAVDSLPTPALLTVLDSQALIDGRDAPARTLLGHGRTAARSESIGGSQRPQTTVSGIVIAQAPEQLPAACTTIVHVGADGAAKVELPQERSEVEDIVYAGISLDTAQHCAQNLARFDDPELKVPGASLPALVTLPELLGYREPNAASIQQLWHASTGVSTPVGVSEDGAFTLDMVKDGPHGLVGGTTGSGKSEFLRSLVAGLAARNDATQLNFILIDFKGGAAFKALEQLPHTIGTISNLDAQLADRALRALEAEMERRQRIFAAAGEGVDNLVEYLKTNPAEPMPRLMLVIDEFAMLAKDFPDVLEALVAVAAVGRTLGVHMILATQRPAGVVSEDILANTNMRVALRVQSNEDSSNVIGVKSAASISRSQMGRAYVKLGQDDITPVQTALVTGQSNHEDMETQVLQVKQFGVPETPPRTQRAQQEANDLDLLIDAILAAHQAEGFAPPRLVWPEALGERVELAGFEHLGTGAVPGGAGTPLADDSSADTDSESAASARPTVGGVENGIVQVALVDEPDLQRQRPAGWNIGEGNLLLMGVPGSGTTTTLASLALDLALNTDPAALDLFILDMGAGELAPLKNLPHTVAYVGPGEGAEEQQARFLRHLETELVRRRNDPDGRRKAVVLIDGLAALRDAFDDVTTDSLINKLYRAWADGPAVGLHFAAATSRSKSVPPAIADITVQKWVYRLADSSDYSFFSLRGSDVPMDVPGRCVDPRNKLQMHIATPNGTLTQAVEQVKKVWANSQHEKESTIRRLPAKVTVRDLEVTPQLDNYPYRVPVGILESDLSPASLVFYEGDHAMIPGAVRSGKSTLLRALGDELKAAGARVWVICDRRSPLSDAPFDKIALSPDEAQSMLTELEFEERPVFILMDDIERYDDQSQSMNDLVLSGRPGVHIIAAGRAADLRAKYDWTKSLRRARLGVHLKPDVDNEQDLMATKLPYKSPVPMLTGRGYLLQDGHAFLIQSIAADNAGESVEVGAA